MIFEGLSSEGLVMEVENDEEDDEEREESVERSWRIWVLEREWDDTKWK